MQNESNGKIDISSCEKEPIHIPGMIQSHGILLALRQSDLTILQVSDSVFEMLGIHPSELMHQPLSKLMNTEPIEKASVRLGERLPRLLNPIPVEIKVHGQVLHFDGILHRSGRIIILELEKHAAEEKTAVSLGGFYETLRELISTIMTQEHLLDIFDLCCEEVRKLTGFDRVLIYKFDEDWNGTVIAESKVDAISSLMHHRFPASDIPKQARDLYTTNWLRLIPNVDYKPSRLVPVENPITNKPLDLSNAVLRSVSPVHLEYMRNMGQGASMSISLLKKRQLWGLISCHNASPRYLTYNTRVACEFIGQMISSQIMAKEESEELDHRLQLKAIYDDLLRKGGSYGEMVLSLQENAAKILALTDSQGAALCFGEESICIGATPPAEDVEKLRRWLTGRPQELVVTDSLPLLYPEAAGFVSKATGFLGIKINRGLGDAIMWFRPELREQIPWGGNPNLQKTHSPDGKIHPRASFATWMEVVAGKSKKWKSVEIGVADELRTAILGVAQRDHTPLAPGEHDPHHGFRSSLANAIATTAITLNDREPDKKDLERPQTFKDIADNSRVLLEGFAEFAVLFLDLHGKIQSWSAGAQRLFGYTTKQTVGNGLQLFFAEDEVLKQKHDRVIEHVKNRGRCEEELWLYRHDRTSFWGKIMVTQVRNDRDALIGYSIVIQDITKERAAEEELKSTKLAAEAANVAKTAFLANISHEIRTPLGAILGFSEVLVQKGQTPEERNELYKRIQRNGDQLTALINDLLDITKVESGRLEIEKMELDLQELLVDLQQTFSIKAAEKSLNFSIQIQGPVPSKVISDPTRLRQILVNLLSNAIKFTNHGGSVTLQCAVETAGTLSFRVIDTGRGISENEMSRLFQPFVQADASTTRKYGGTGLGLFVSQRLARALNGDLCIEKSALGEGTTFLAKIDAGHPKFNSTFEVLSPPEKSTPAALVESESLKGLNILVVEDSPDNRFLIDIYLTQSGAVIDTAENGKEGVEKALAHDYDIVLMDIQMPVMDGNLAMQSLVTAGFKKPVIALTAHAMNEERERSLSVGFSDYVTKPINRDLLIRSIRSLVRGT